MLAIFTRHNILRSISATGPGRVVCAARAEGQWHWFSFEIAGHQFPDREMNGCLLSRVG